MWPIHIVDYRSARKRKELLKHVTKRVTLKMIILNEKSQDKKEIHTAWLHLYRNLENEKYSVRKHIIVLLGIGYDTVRGKCERL